MSRFFDLNIEKVLDSWEAKHAVREIIANALDEQILTNTEEIKIYKENNKWHIRDYGRGLQYTHFTQNENKEKIESSNLIGKFGVGLKDALAVFYRKNIKVEINSKYAHVTLTMNKKSGFDIETLHAKFDDSIDENFVGTDFIIEGIDDQSIYDAKSMFLVFNNEELLEETKYGNVYRHTGDSSSIYINGVQVAKEDNFLFSYNITNINSQIKKALNRERTNVGRTAYSDTIKNILTQCKKEEVLLTLVKDLENIMRGTNKDETNWVDVATYAAKTLNTKGNVVFLTPYERASLSNQQIEILNNSGKEVILITDNVYNKLDNSVTTYKDVYKDYANSFKYEFVSQNNLTKKEKEIFDTVYEYVTTIFEQNDKETDVEVKISETIKLDESGQETLGVYDLLSNSIIIKRTTLQSIEKFAGVLVHEFTHYQTGYQDNSREFETELTNMIGLFISEKINYYNS